MPILQALDEGRVHELLRNYDALEKQLLLYSEILIEEAMPRTGWGKSDKQDRLQPIFQCSTSMLPKLSGMRLA